MKSCPIFFDFGRQTAKLGRFFKSIEENKGKDVINTNLTIINELSDVFCTWNRHTMH
jgi:hypothetical protein